jgi:UTP--glucose-1-phosphate uridylyltransferase
MMPPKKIRTAVIPAAGLGSRFLPATKVVPKELLPIAGRPLIQHAVEEAAASGLESAILVVGPGKNILTAHFERDVTLESKLRQAGRPTLAAEIRQLSQTITIRTAWQESPRGLADAIACARSEVGDEPFAVILPDAFIDSAVPCTRQLMDCYASTPGCIVATQMVEPEELDRFGIVVIEPALSTFPRGCARSVVSLLEKPAASSLPPSYGIIGRYVLEPGIFRNIDQIRAGVSGELQLTDALSLCLRMSPVYAYHFEGTHFDAGSPLGFLQANLAEALKDPEQARCLRKQFIEQGASLVEASP